jgi:hypothetical protein
MPLTRKAALVLDMIAIIIIAVVAIGFFVALSGSGSTTISGILGDWFSSIHAPQIGKPDITVYGECTSGPPFLLCKQVVAGITHLYGSSCRTGSPKVTVSNQGESDISKNLTFLICVDLPGSLAKTQLQEVSGLRIGQEKTYSFVSAGASGDYNVVADCQDQVAEIIESNNFIDLNCPGQYLVNCYETATIGYQGEYISCPFYCNEKIAYNTQTCRGVNATVYPDKLINLTDCGACPSDNNFEGGCYCPSYCRLYWDEQIGPGASCGGLGVPKMGGNASYYTCGMSKNSRDSVIQDMKVESSQAQYFPDYITYMQNKIPDLLKSANRADNTLAKTYQDNLKEYYSTGEFCSCAGLWDPEKDTKGLYRESYVPRGASCAWFDPTTQVLSDCTAICPPDGQSRGCFCPSECDKDFVLPGESCTVVKT